MAKSKRILSGDGWSFEPAGGGDAPIVRESLPPERQRVRVVVEKRPKGKIATVVSGFVLSDEDRKALAADLKKRCGTGGSVADATLEVQGDHRDAVMAHLVRLGWSVK